MTIETTHGPLYDAVRADYFRHLPKDMKETEIVPAWVGRVERFCLEDITNRSRDKMLGFNPERPGFASQMTDGLNLFSNSLVLANTSDADVLRAFSHSLRCFWPGSPLSSSQQQPEKALAKKIVELHRDGADVLPFATWFSSIRGFAINGDPILFRKMVSPNTLGKPVGALVGLHDRTAANPDTFFNHAENSAIITRIADFSLGVANELQALESDDGVISSIRENADMTSKTIRKVKEGEFKQVSILRPMPVGSLVYPMAHAVVSHIKSDVEMSEAESETIAEAVVRGIRRKRAAWDKDTVFSLVASLSDPTFVRSRLNYYHSETTELGREIISMNAGEAIEVIDQIGPSGSKSKIVDFVMGSVRENLVFRLRADGMHLFEWEEDDYRWLGMPKDLWSRHNERLHRERELQAQLKTMGDSIIGDSSLILEYFGEYNPVTWSHRAVCEDVLNLKLHDFIRSGIVGSEFGGRINLCVNINTGNRGKKSAAAEIRRELFQRSLQGLDNVYLWDTDERSSLPTAEKLSSHREHLEAKGVKVENMVRVCGTDKLSQNGRYEDDQEPNGGSHVLNNSYPHIWVMQREDMADIDSFHMRISTIQENYPRRAVIVIPSYLDLHSSDFRNQAGRYSDLLLSTAVHPSIIADIKSIYT